LSRIGVALSVTLRNIIVTQRNITSSPFASIKQTVTFLSQVISCVAEAFLLSSILITSTLYLIGFGLKPIRISKYRTSSFAKRIKFQLKPIRTSEYRTNFFAERITFSLEAITITQNITTS